MDPPVEPTSNERAVALYHVVYAHETFDDAAQALFALIRNAEDKRPGKPRRLFLDIEGHRTADGLFNDDMRELQQGFFKSFLSRYLSEIQSPTFQLKNRNQQINNIPPELRIEDRTSDPS